MPRLVAVAALLMVLLPEAALTARFAAACGALAGLYPKRRRTGQTYQGYVRALVKWSPRLLAGLEPHYRALVRAAAGSRWTLHGFVPIGCDGSRIDLPHTPAMLKAFGCGGKKKSGPTAWLVMLEHVGLKLPWAWKTGRATADERGLLRRMVALLPPEVLLIADAGYTGFDFWTALIMAEKCFLIRVGGNVRLLKNLGGHVEERGNRVFVWPARQQKNRVPPLELRLVVLPGPRNTRIYLVTNVLECERLSDEQAAEFYALRWNVELRFRGLKQTLSKRRMRSQSPLLAALELRWTALGLAVLNLWAVRAVMAGGGGENGDPRRVSLAGALRQVRETLGSLGGKRPRGRSLQWRLAAARLDDCRRQGPKAAKLQVRKKNDRPPGPPKILIATPEQIRMANEVMMRN